MKFILPLVLMTLVNGHAPINPALEGESVGKLDWQAIPPRFATMFEKQTDGQTALKIPSSISPVPILSVPDSLREKIDKPAYAVLGEVRSLNVDSGAFLELQSYFGTGLHTTRDLGSGGPMGDLVGTQNWREFWLPFKPKLWGELGKPSHLQVNLVWTGPGTVYLRNLRLVQYDDLERDSYTQLEINVTSSWFNGLEYSIDGITYQNLDPIRRLLETNYRHNPQDNIVIRHPSNIDYAALHPLSEVVQDSGFEPWFGESKNPSPFFSWELKLTNWVIVFVLLFLSAILLITFFLIRLQNRLRHQRELRRIASLDS